MRSHEVRVGPLAKNRKPIVRFRSSYLIRYPFARSGFIVVGPHWLGILTTICVIMGGTWMNLRLLEKTSNLGSLSKTALQVFIYFFCIETQLCLLWTALADPGIVFPQSMEDDPALLQEEWEIKRLSYCDICTVLTPDQSCIGHCYTCGYCIEGMDHHCPWMGQCIGKRNKFAFIVFNVSWVIFFLEYFFLAIIGETG